MLLTEDQLLIRDAVRAFAREQLWPHAPAWDKGHTFPVEAHRGLAELGACDILMAVAWLAGKPPARTI